MEVYIYALCDETGDIRYIGKSADPWQRYTVHLQEYKNPKFSCHRYNWLRSMEKKGRKPKLLLLQRVPNEEWPEWERTWISVCREAGMNITNDTDGGEGRVGPLSEITRSRISAYRKGKYVNPPGQPLKEEHRQNIANALVGNKYAKGKTWKLSEETKNNMKKAWELRRAKAGDAL